MLSLYLIRLEMEIIFLEVKFLILMKFLFKIQYKCSSTQTFSTLFLAVIKKHFSVISKLRKLTGKVF